MFVIQNVFLNSIIIRLKKKKKFTAFIEILNTKNTDTEGLAGLFWTALLLAIVVAFALLVMAGLVYRYRHSRYILTGQVAFAYFLLLGLFLIAIGSGMLAVDPQDATCIVQVWMINLGYVQYFDPVVCFISFFYQLTPITPLLP